MKFYDEFKNLENKVKNITANKEVKRSQRAKNLIYLTNIYIVTYSYIEELKGSPEYRLYLDRMYTIRDVISAYVIGR